MYNREQMKEKCRFQEWKWKHFAAIVGVWRAIANKMEASQEICCIHIECLESLGREIGKKLH